MKRTLSFVFSLLFIVAGTLKLAAQIDGLMFSMTYGGGNPTSPFGVINQFDPIAYKDTATFEFTGLNGAEPYGNFIQLNNGLLYGMTAYNCVDPHHNPLSGSIIQYNIQTGKDSILYTLPPTGGTYDSGEYFFGNLYHATNDLLYGMTYQGGTPANSGVIFSYNYHTGSYRVLSQLRGKYTGSYPAGSLIQVSPTLLYGLTTYNFNDGYTGTIFTYNIHTGDTNRVYTFTGGTDGGDPTGNLLQASNGLLYGLTENGGTGLKGVLFSFDTGTKTETVLVNFNGPNGATPYRGLIQATDGDLYGTTTSGGAHDSGTLFRYNIGTNTETVLYSFNGSDTDGYFPYADVIQASDGKLYGSTNGNPPFGAGKNNWGTIFRYDLTTNTKKTLYYFKDTNNGAYPYGDLLEVMSDKVIAVYNICPYDASGSLTINVRGGKLPYTYLWSTGATTSSITNLTSGIYSDTVWDSRGIRFVNIDTVKPLPMVLHFNVSNPCNGSNEDSVSVRVSGGTAPYIYTWSNAQTTDTLYHLASGTYTCSITDANGCTASNTVVITQAAPLVITSIMATEQTYPFNNGKVVVRVTGGIPPGDSACYLFIWSNGGSSTDSITHLDSGTYSVCVTSCYGCGSTCSDSVKVLTNIRTIAASGNLVNVYPIPSTGLITLNLVGNNFENIEITNTLGVPVYKETLNSPPENNTLHIDLGAQPNGVYILFVTSQQGVSTRKIIIQK